MIHQADHSDHYYHTRCTLQKQAKITAGTVGWPSGSLVTLVLLTLYFQADFSLLFHCVVNNAKIAFEVLLEAGADPTLPNNVGNSVLHPIIKRGLLDWAELAIKGLSQETRIEFLNKASFSGIDI